MIDLCVDLEILGIPSFIAYDKGEELSRFVSKLRKTKPEIISMLKFQTLLFRVIALHMDFKLTFISLNYLYFLVAF